MNPIKKFALIFIAAASMSITTACTGIPPITEIDAMPETTNSAPVKDDTATSSQKQAVRSAEFYLEVAGCSKAGLEAQLVFDKFSKADAKYAVNHIDVDWKEQAVRSAKQYLEISGYSEEGLAKQLRFDKYTEDQAAYGAKKALN